MCLPAHMNSRRERRSSHKCDISEVADEIAFAGGAKGLSEVVAAQDLDGSLNEAPPRPAAVRHRACAPRRGRLAALSRLDHGAQDRERQRFMTRFDLVGEPIGEIPLPR